MGAPGLQKKHRTNNGFFSLRSERASDWTEAYPAARVAQASLRAAAASIAAAVSRGYSIARPEPSAIFSASLRSWGKIEDYSFIFFGGQGHPGRARGTLGKAREGVPRAPWGPPGFPLGPPGPSWVPLASKKEKMGSTFNERRVMKKKEYKQILSRFSGLAFGDFG